jgi:hypothetical protein
MGYRRTVGGFGTALEIKRLMLLVFAIFWRMMMMEKKLTG